MNEPSTESTKDQSPTLSYSERTRQREEESFGADSRSIAELLPVALAEIEDDSRDSLSHAFGVLQHRGSKEASQQEIFELALKLCKSTESNERELGTTILGQNLIYEKNFPDQKFDILFGLISSETNPDVLSSVCFALGHIHDPKAIEHTVKLKGHPDEDVRDAVVFSLLAHNDDLAIKTLIELSSDVDDDVRDWATFGLGTQIETDTEQIREALFKRLEDEHDDTSFEAEVGLARRNDERMMEPLLKALASNDVEYRTLEIVADSNNPVFCSALMALREKWHGIEDDLFKQLEYAIDMCDCEDDESNEVAEPDVVHDHNI